MQLHKSFSSRLSDGQTAFGSTVMMELTPSQQNDVSGGILPVVIFAAGAASGAATMLAALFLGSKSE